MEDIEIAPRIIVSEAVHPGRPLIRGTRIQVSVVLGSLAAGMSVDEVAQEYDLTREDVLAALSYAQKVIEHELVLPLPGSRRENPSG